MGERRSTSALGYRFEFGPWWWRWWLLLTTDGKRHAVITGEPCVIYRERKELLRQRNEHRAARALLFTSSEKGEPNG